MSEIYLRVGQVPAAPLKISVTYEGSPLEVDFTKYSTVLLRIVNPNGLGVVNWAGDLDDVLEGKVLVLPWRDITVSETTFSLPGDYTAQITLTGTDAVDITSESTIQVFKRI